MRRRKPILWLLLPLVFLCLLLPGCFTSALWGKDLDDTSLTSEETYEHEKPVPLWIRIVCTPLAIALDILTAPLQDLVSDEDDDDDDCNHAPSAHRRR
jgi:hypothetical protein